MLKALFYITHRNVATITANAHKVNTAIIIANVASPTHNDPAVITRTAHKDGTAIIECAYAKWANAAAVITTTAHVTKCA